MKEERGRRWRKRREQSSCKRSGRNEANAGNGGRIEMRRCEEDERKNKCVKYQMETNRR